MCVCRIEINITLHNINTDIFLNKLVQFYSNNATNHHFTQYTVLPRNIQIVLWLQIYYDVTSSYLWYDTVYISLWTTHKDKSFKINYLLHVSG